MGRGGGLVVTVLAVYSFDSSLNPDWQLNLFEVMKRKEKEAGAGPTIKRRYSSKKYQEGCPGSLVV